MSATFIDGGASSLRTNLGTPIYPYTWVVPALTGLQPDDMVVFYWGVNWFSQNPVLTPPAGFTVSYGGGTGNVVWWVYAGPQSAVGSGPYTFTLSLTGGGTSDYDSWFEGHAAYRGCTGNVSNYHTINPINGHVDSWSASPFASTLAVCGGHGNSPGAAVAPWTQREYNLLVVTNQIVILQDLEVDGDATIPLCDISGWANYAVAIGLELAPTVFTPAPSSLELPPSQMNLKQFPNRLGASILKGL